MRGMQAAVITGMQSGTLAYEECHRVVRESWLTHYSFCGGVLARLRQAIEVELGLLVQACQLFSC